MYLELRGCVFGTSNSFFSAHIQPSVFDGILSAYMQRQSQLPHSSSLVTLIKHETYSDVKKGPSAQNLKKALQVSLRSNPSLLCSMPILWGVPSERERLLLLFLFPSHYGPGVFYFSHCTNKFLRQFFPWVLPKQECLKSFVCLDLPFPTRTSSYIRISECEKIAEAYLLWAKHCQG